MRHALETVILMLSPIVPHFAEELWQALGHSESTLLVAWPSFRKDALVQDEATIVVQVNGKLRSRFSTEMDTGDDILKEIALADEKVQKFVEGKAPKKIIVVKNKLVNIVV